MEYKELSKLYHMDSTSSRDANIQAAYQSRFGSESSFRIGFATKNGELFFTVPRELSALNERILKAERKISGLLAELPSVAGNALLRSMVLDEVVCTNQIEAIHSTRRQVKDALEAASSGHSQERRFKEIATLYLGIIDGTAKIPCDVEGVRAIYNDVTAREIPKDRLPDGRLFRRDGVDVVGSGGRIIHSGLHPEERIVEAMGVMLALVRDDRIPSLYAAVASHYLFEYAHPFYDGNGRTGRYLLSLFLSDSLSVPTVLSLSRAVAENKLAYYRAFANVENPLNRSELTFFIYAMLEMVEAAQLGIVERLEESGRKLAELAGLVDEVTVGTGLRSKEAQVVSLLLQYEMFGLLGDASLAEIAEYLGIKPQMARKYVASLEGRGIVERQGKRSPLTFALTQPFKDRYGIASS